MTRRYERKVIYLFESAGETWAVLGFTDTTINFEETRKNGQEDCHMDHCEAELVDGKWVLDKWSRRKIEDYGPAGACDAIEAFFNERGTPDD